MGSQYGHYMIIPIDAPIAHDTECLHSDGDFLWYANEDPDPDGSDDGVLSFGLCFLAECMIYMNNWIAVSLK